MKYVDKDGTKEIKFDLINFKINFESSIRVI